MTGTPLVVLDACVLANFSLCDTLLRLAEPPPLFEPKWSDEIIMAKLEQQAADRNRTLRQLLSILGATVPEFVSLVSDEISRK